MHMHELTEKYIVIFSVYSARCHFSEIIPSRLFQRKDDALSCPPSKDCNVGLLEHWNMYLLLFKLWFIVYYCLC